MTYAAGPTNNLQQWLNKYVPELQSNKPVQRASSAQNPHADAFKKVESASPGESVSLSSQARALSDATRQSYSEAQIDHEKIKNSCHDLYEKGCITAEEFGRLTGEKLPHEGNISQTIQFLSEFIEVESVEGDVEGAKALGGALDVLRHIEDPMTALRAGQERQATGYVHEYRDLLQEAGADSDLIHEFDRVVNVFDALAGLREQTHQGVVTTYASLSAQLRNPQ